MPVNTFWSYFPSDNTENGFIPTDYEGARTALIAAVPNAMDWQYNCNGWRRDLPLAHLLRAINYLDFDETIRKFLPAQRIQPEKIMLITDPELFRGILFTTPRPGSITFQWNATNTVEDGAKQVPAKSRVIKSIYRRVAWNPDKEEYSGPEHWTLAVCVLEGTRLEVYAAPRDWNQIAEEVMGRLKRMTVREKAAKDLEPTLRGLINLLGKEAVQEALNKL